MVGSSELGLEGVDSGKEAVPRDDPNLHCISTVLSIKGVGGQTIAVEATIARTRDFR